MMDDKLGYIKYVLVGMIPAIAWVNWAEIAITSGLALLAGFMTAFGGFLAKFLTNWLKKKWTIFRTKE